MINNGYITLAEMRMYITKPDDLATESLEGAVTDASRVIDSVCHRRFYLDGGATARVFRPSTALRVSIDDASAVTSVKIDRDDDGTFEQIWTTADYDEEPLNGIGHNGVSGWPVTSIRAVGSLTFPYGRRPTVEVTATWGWTAVPDPIKRATMQLAHRLYDLRGAALGVANFNDLVGVIEVTRSIPGWTMLVKPFSATGLLVG